jgi:hypothetical protein
MAGWFFQLKGDRSDLEQAATLFEAGATRVAREGDEFWMRSAESDAFAPPDHLTAQSAAEIALEVLNGISFLRVQNTGRLTLGRAEYGEASAPRSIFLIIGGVQLTARVGSPTVTVGGQPSQPREDPWLTVASQNAHVAEAMRLYGSREPDWRDLYFILELVEEEIGMTASRKGWTTNNVRQLFRRTADNRAVLGNLARHGTSRKPPPKHPMALPDARRLIRTIVERWVNEKVRGI